MPRPQPGLAQCSKHSLGGLGALGGPGASQEVALLQQGCPFWSHHTLGVTPHAGTGQPEQSQAIRCKSYLEKTSAPRGLQWWEDPSLHEEPHKLQPLLRALPQPVPVPCCESSTGLEPSTDTLPSKAAIYSTGVCPGLSTGNSSPFYAFMARNTNISFSCLHHHFPR